MRNDTSESTMTDIAALRDLLEKATKGPWECDTTHNEGCYGSGEDVSEGFKSYTILAGDGKVLFDSLNSDAIEVQEEYDEDGTSAWDETARLNAALIVAAINALPALLDRLEKAEGELAEAREDVRSLCRFILNEWGPDGALKATTFALEQRQSAKGGDANAAPDRDTNSKSATSPGVTAGASALASARAEGRKEGLEEAATPTLALVLAILSAKEGNRHE